MLWKFKHLLGATWLYLNQPLCQNQEVAVWQPRQFWYLYQIQLFETCWCMSGKESRPHYH